MSEGDEASCDFQAAGKAWVEFSFFGFKRNKDSLNRFNSLDIGLAVSIIHQSRF